MKLYRVYSVYKLTQLCQASYIPIAKIACHSANA